MFRSLRSTRNALCGAAMVAIVAAGTTAHAQQEQVERIAAVVNDEVISTSDVATRLQMALASSGLPNTAESRQRLLPQVLRILVDERLQLQEARRLEIQVTDQDIDRAIAGLAQQNRMTPVQFRTMVEQAGIPFAALREQMRANVAWQQLVARRVRPTVSISEEEVEAVIERTKANAGKPEFLVSEIFLAVDDPANEGQVQALGQRLVEQIGAGANFANVARQFSQSAAAAAGGELGWLQTGQLEPALDQALSQLRPGQFSRPIRGSSGYHILWLRDERTAMAGNPADIQVAVGQLVLPLQEGSEPMVVQNQAQQIAAQVSSCDALESVARGIPGAQTGRAPLTRLGDLPGEIGRLVADLGVNRASQPLITDRGIMLLMVCDRMVPEGSTPPRDEIREQIGFERLEMLQRRYLRDLRRDATVEYRL